MINFENLEHDNFINNDKEIRLDLFLKEKVVDFSRKILQDHIKEGYVLVNDNVITKPSFILKNNDLIDIYYKEVEATDLKPLNIPLDIVYEDDDLLVINKQAGLVTHPSAGHYNDSLVNALLFYNANLSTINGVSRPGIVHRLDKDTSGLLVIAKNDKAHLFLQDQLKDHTMKRTYYALCYGIPETTNGLIKTLIGRDEKNRLRQAVVLKNGKEAITEFSVIENFSNKYSLIKCVLQTGRTHQIRVHMNFIHCPVVNDELYGINNKIGYECYQLLHAKEITFIHPTSKEVMHFECDLPKRFKEAIKYINEKNL